MRFKVFISLTVSTGLGLLAALVLCFSTPANAIEISFTVADLGASTWEYRYTLRHDGSLGGDPVQAFAIGFDPALYDEASLTIVSEPPASTDWDEQILASGVALDAFYDVQATAGGLVPGQSASGFRVRFRWLGTAAPGPQPFWIFQNGSSVVLEQGQTVSITHAIPLVDGRTLLVLIVALGLLASLCLRGRC